MLFTVIMIMQFENMRYIKALGFTPDPEVDFQLVSVYATSMFNSKSFLFFGYWPNSKVLLLFTTKIAYVAWLTLILEVA